MINTLAKYRFEPAPILTKKQIKMGMRQYNSGGCCYLPTIRCYKTVAMLNILSQNYHQVNEIYLN